MLSAMSSYISTRLTQSIQFCMEWAGDTRFSDYSVELVKDYGDASAETSLMELVKLVDGKKMSYKSFFNALKTKELVEEQKTWEEEIKDIEDEDSILPKSAEKEAHEQMMKSMQNGEKPNGKEDNKPKPGNKPAAK